MDLKAILLGTSAGVPSKFRGMPSMAIFYQDKVLLFDCGEGTQLQLMRGEVSFMRIDRIFITHYHGDHIYGLPGLLSTMAFNKRSEPIHIYGPSGLGKILKAIQELGYFPRSFPIYHHELGDDEIDFGPYTVVSREVDHPVTCLAYSFAEKPYRRFDEKRANALGVPRSSVRRELKEGKSVIIGGKRITPEMVLGEVIGGRKVVYSVDTRPAEAVAEMAMGCDLLIHEATFASDMREECYRYGHSTASDAATIAKKAGAKKLVLTHISSRYGKGSELALEAREIFRNVEMGRDFASYPIKKTR
jgi:ribonuclease Z